MAYRCLADPRLPILLLVFLSAFEESKVYGVVASSIGWCLFESGVGVSGGWFRNCKVVRDWGFYLL